MASTPSPHRTFQEYLAACHLTDAGFPEMAELLRGDPNRWREVLRSAGAKATRGTAVGGVDLADALCFQLPVHHESEEEGGVLGSPAGGADVIEL